MKCSDYNKILIVTFLLTACLLEECVALLGVPARTRHRQFLVPSPQSRSLSASSLASTTLKRIETITDVVDTTKAEGDGNIPATAVEAEQLEHVKPEFYVPKDERNRRCRLFSVDVNMGSTRLLRTRRLCPTRELNFTTKLWSRHKNPWRRVRHVVNFYRSSAFQRLLFPDLVGIAAVSIALTLYNVVLAPHAVASISNSAFAGATTAIGLLAGFRLNSSYSRYTDCRMFWGQITNTMRDLASQSMMLMKDTNQKSRLLKLCKAFPVALLFHLNAKGCYYDMKRKCDDRAPFEDRVQAEFEAELRESYVDGKDEGDFERLCAVKRNGGNAPLEVLVCMRETIAASISDGMDSHFVCQLDEQCQKLCASLGSCERLLRTPIPTGFTRHSSRLMFIWSHCLPFALYPAMGLLTLPTALMTSYAVLGIDDIGVQLEEPFDILPLRQYSDGIFDAVDAIEKSYKPYKLSG